MFAFNLWALGHSLVAEAAQGNIFDDTTLIPRVDLRLPQNEIISAVRKAAESGGPGFFYLIGHGIDESVFDDTVREAHKFYSLPRRQKLNVSAIGYGGGNNPTKGYVPPLSEGAYTKDAIDVRPDEEVASGKRNTRESFVFRYPEEHELKHKKYLADYEQFLTELDGSTHDASLKNAASNPSRRENRVHENVSRISAEARRFFAINQWPSHEDAADFRVAVQRYIDEMKSLSRTVFGLFSEALLQSLGHEVNFSFPVEDVVPHDQGMVTFNVVHYPPCHVEDAMGIVDHTDWEMFTLLAPFYLRSHHVGACSGGGTNDQCVRLQKINPNVDEVSGVYFTGLEVWFQGRWVAVPRIPGAILVNQGEMLSRLSHGKFKAPVHRVQALNDFERYSLVSFWAPNYDVFIPDPHVPYGNILAGEHYLDRNGFLV